MNEQEARKLLKKICDWLEEGAPGSKIKKPSESIPADLARDFATELLESAGAEGYSGCPLCQG